MGDGQWGFDGKEKKEVMVVAARRWRWRWRWKERRAAVGVRIFSGSEGKLFRGRK